MHDALQPQAPTVTYDDLLAGMARLGIGPGTRLAVHSSLSSMGHVAGGAETVVAALMDAVRPGGTLVMPAQPVTRSARLTDADRAAGVAWKLRRIHPDDRETRSGMGLIADTFVRRPDVILSDAPLHRVAAWGDQAERFCQGFAPLVDAGGTVLLLGVRMDRCSALHVAEARVPLPPALAARVQAPIPETVQQRYPLDAWVVGMDSGWGDFLVVERLADAQGLLRRTRIGAATAIACEAAAVVGLYARLLRDDPYLFERHAGPESASGAEEDVS